MSPTAEDRLDRMRKMFAKDGAVLAEDYNHFTRRGVSTSQSKAARTSVKPRVQPALKPS